MIVTILITIFSILMILGMIWYATHGNFYMLALYLGMFIVLYTILAVCALTKNT